MIDKKHYELYKLALINSSFKEDHAKLIEEFSEFITAINRTENILFEDEIFEEFSDLVIMCLRMIFRYSTPESTKDINSINDKIKEQINNKISRQFKRWDCK